MPTRRVLKSVFHNYLGTYTSRYSEYDGYWLVGDLNNVQFDLLTEVESSAFLVDVAHNLVVGKFAEQLCKARFDPSPVRGASIQIERLDGQLDGHVNGIECGGFKIRFHVAAETDIGRVFECKRVLFVAPHNAGVELQSVRAHRD